MRARLFFLLLFCTSTSSYFASTHPNSSMAFTNLLDSSMLLYPASTPAYTAMVANTINLKLGPINYHLIPLLLIQCPCVIFLPKFSNNLTNHLLKW